MDWVFYCFVVLLFIGYKIEKIYESIVEWQDEWKKSFGLTDELNNNLESEELGNFSSSEHKINQLPKFLKRK